MQPLDLKTARQIIDLSGGLEDLKQLGEIQLKGAVALYNMIAAPGVGMGYLADEVGMGKTYIALAVVALMRYFNPSLRVLYICPSKNVQEKWDREYRSFTQHNVRVAQNRIKTPKGEPASPYISCNNVVEMIEMAASGYYADFFVRKDSFSIGLQDDQSEDKSYWKGKCEEITHLLPAHQWKLLGDESALQSKDDVKYHYARALNYVLPTFDLVVIDEAHNFKHNFNSSARNRVLSRVLGFNETDNYRPRVKHSLLLSATPYDRDINQLRNQLNLVGKSHLLPEEVKSPEDIKNTLKRFMVRRLNTLNINGKEHTRNMYRIEHRKGADAEIHLSSDEQKLVTALVQKKVGDLMNQEGASPSFQTGMLSSFESYAQTSKAETIKFDGDETEKKNKDAQDRHIIEHIVDSYKDAGLGLTLPHPKMDSVCFDLSKKLFDQSQKQIIFVRRVRSVKEIKEKLDNAYNQWLKEYINRYLKGFPQQKIIFENLFEEYKKQSREKDSDISEGIFHEGNEEGEQEDHQPPKNDTFFSWFFRGAAATNVSQLLTIDQQTLITPEAIRKGLSSKSQQISLLFEMNWAYRLCKHHHLKLRDIIKQYGDDIAYRAKKYHTGILAKDYQDIYRACQLGVIEWFADQYQIPQYMEIVHFLKPSILNQSSKIFTLEEVHENLLLITFFTELHRLDIEDEIFPRVKSLLDNFQQQKKETLTSNTSLLEKINIHWHLISLCLRTGHGVIDLYLSRIKLGGGDLDKKRRTRWIMDLVFQIKKQAQSKSFSTWQELYLTADQLDLIIKNNIADISNTALESRRKELSQWLNPVAPVIGATGETYGSRSAQARKFRMPGYPLALVTTDVLQEGEDLHTFCDSVLHYGITGSPVSIEQKTGRVDRVYSMAQRRLLKIQSVPVNNNDFIQVSFPHIKESIELLQLRQLCYNLNEFTNSLHEIGTEQLGDLENVNTDQALLDRSEIPEQIKTFLKSPFVPEVTEASTYTEHLINEIEQSADKALEITAHINKLIKRHGQNLTSPSEGALKVTISSTRGIGETLIIGEIECGEFHLRDEDLEKAMIEKSWQTFHRIQAEKVGTDLYLLSKNSEMLVGNEHVTQDEDIKHFFNSFSETHHPQYTTLSSGKVKSYCELAQQKGVTINNKNLSVVIQYINEESRKALVFDFGEDQLHRKHTVDIFESDGYCIFISKAVSPESIDSYGSEKERKIIEYTWIRNKKVDLVEFLLDKEGGISGRVIHPIGSLDWKEFIFCAYVLAVEADRLEYLFNHQDVF